MKTATPRGYAFHIRLWPAAPDSTDPVGWQVTLEDARSAERLGVASLKQLFAHVM